MISAASSNERPHGFVLATCIVIMHAILGFIGFTPAFPFGVFGAITVSIAYPYFFWRGKNWARVAVLCICLANLLLLFIELRKNDPMRTTRNVLGSVLALFLLYWLNTPPVRSYFRRPSGRTII